MLHLLTYLIEPWRSQMHYPLIATECSLFLCSFVSREHSCSRQTPRNNKELYGKYCANGPGLAGYGGALTPLKTMS